MEKMELDLKECEMKKKTLGKMCESLNSQASSVLVFTLELKELEERLDSISFQIQTRFKELYEREQQLDAKISKVESELVEHEKVIEEKRTEATDTMNYLNSLQLSLKQMEKVVGDTERRIQELNGVERHIGDRLNNSREELNLIQMKIQEESKRLDEIVKSAEEKSKLASEEQKKAFRMKQEDLMSKVKQKIKDQCLRKKSMEEMSCILERKERELQVKEQKILSKVEEVDALNKRAIQEFQKAVMESEADHQLKEKQLEVKSETMEKLHQEREKQLEEKERQLEAKMDTMKKLHQELEAQKRKLEETTDTIQKLHQEREKQHEAQKRKVEETTDIIEKLHQEREKQLEAKERQLEVKNDTLEKLHQEHVQQLEAKVRQLEEQGKELELRKKQFGSSRLTAKSEPLETTPAATTDPNNLPDLLKVVVQHEQAADLSCAIRTPDKEHPNNISVASDKSEKAVSPDVVQSIERLIQQKRLVNAYGRIKRFKLFRKFPPGQVLKEFVERGMKCMEKSKKRKRPHEQEKVVNNGITDLQRVIDCIKAHNLKSPYTTESLQKQILVLQKFMEERRNENPKKRLCSTVDSSFQQHEHKLQRTSLTDRPFGLHPDFPNPGVPFYNGQLCVPSNNYHL